MLEGFTPPYSPTGKSSLIPAPPWHYAGRIMSLACALEAARYQAFLPEGFGAATGMAYGHFCEWQATTDGSELLDPIYAQYREFFYLLEAQKDGKKRLFCPFIYVDQDLSLMRGLLQGWPKKIGSVWITRSYDIEHRAAARTQAGTKLGASLAVKDRRLAQAQIELTGKLAEPMGFLATPTYGLVGQPTIIDAPSPGPKRLVRQSVSGVVRGPLHAAQGALTLFESPRDELGVLAPEETLSAAICDFGFSVDGARLADQADQGT